MSDPSTNQSRYQRAKAVLEAALEKSEDERDDYVRKACAGDGPLRAEVDSLLQAHDGADSGFLVEPVALAPDGADSDLELTDLRGQRVGAYRLERLLGRGGMGAVYLAARDDGEFEKRVAVKFVRTRLATPALLRRFRNERQILAALEHPNIARLLDGGTAENGLPYLIMEYVEGETLANALKRGALPFREALRLARGVAEALSAMHSQGLVFRDLKPTNVMLTPDGRVKVLDFGIAKIVRQDPEDSRTTVTAPGWIVGSPSYMAPEQAIGAQVDQRSDVFAFGILLFEALTGRLPFKGDTTPAYLHNLTHAKASKLPRSFSPPLRRLVDKCLRKDPARRFQSGGDLARGIRSISRSHGADGKRPPVRGSVPAWATGVTALVLVAYLVVTGGLFTGDREGPVPVPGAPTPVATWASNERDPRISPDGRWFSFVSDRENQPKIWLRATAGDAEIDIAPRGGRLQGHVWSADSDRIAYLTTTASRKFLHLVSISDPDEHDAYEVDVDNPALVRWIGDRVYLLADSSLWRLDLGERPQLQEVTNRRGTFRLRTVDVSADEQRIVFAALTDGLSSLWVADLDGSNAKQLTFERMDPKFPRWIGASDEIVYISGQSGQIDVWHMQVATRKMTQLTFGQSKDARSDVSRDGSLLLVESITENADVAIVDPGSASSRVAPITRDSLSDLLPSASGDGHIVAFQRANHLDLAGGHYDATIRVVRGESQATDEIIADGFAPEVSPSGSWMAYLTTARSGRAELRIKSLEDDSEVLVPERFVRAGRSDFPINFVSTNLARSPTREEFYFLAETDDGKKQIRRVVLPGALEQGTSELVFATEATSDAISDLRLSEDGATLSFLVESQARAQWELYEQNLATGDSKRLYFESLGSVPTFLGRLTASREYVILRIVARRASTVERSEVVIVAPDGASRELTHLDNVTLGSAVLDTTRGLVYFVRVENMIHKLYTLALEDGKEHLVVDAGMPGRTFSGLRILDDGRLLFSDHERNQNLWRIEITK